MILEARTLIDADKARLVAAGWRVIRHEGSEWVLRWPDDAGWPPDPRAPRPMACGWNKADPASSPRRCSHWPACECKAPNTGVVGTWGKRGCAH